MLPLPLPNLCAEMLFAIKHRLLNTAFVVFAKDDIDDFVFFSEGSTEVWQNVFYDHHSSILAIDMNTLALLWVIIDFELVAALALLLLSFSLSSSFFSQSSLSFEYQCQIFSI